MAAGCSPVFYVYSGQTGQRQDMRMQFISGKKENKYRVNGGQIR